MQKGRRLDDDIGERLIDLDMPSLLVGRHWGGAGGGLREAAEVLRVLARSDFPTAWNVSIHFATAIMVQRMSPQAQEEASGGDAPFRCSGHLTAYGTTVAVPGGFRLLFGERTGPDDDGRGNHHPQCQDCAAHADRCRRQQRI